MKDGAFRGLALSFWLSGCTTLPGAVAATLSSALSWVSCPPPGFS